MATLASGTVPPLPAPDAPLGIRSVYDTFNNGVSYTVTSLDDVARLNDAMLEPLYRHCYLGDTPLALGAVAAFEANFKALGVVLLRVVSAMADGERPRDALSAEVGRMNARIAAVVAAANDTGAGGGGGGGGGGAAGGGGASGDGAARGGGGDAGGTCGAGGEVSEDGGLLATMAALKATNAEVIAVIRAKSAHTVYTYKAVVDNGKVALSETPATVPTAPLVDSWVPQGLVVVDDDRFNRELPLPAPCGLAAVEDVNARMVEVALEYEHFREPLRSTSLAAYLDNYRALNRELMRLMAAVSDDSRVGADGMGELARINTALATLRAACGARGNVAGGGGDGGAPARVVEAASVSGMSGDVADQCVAALPATVSELMLATATPAVSFAHLRELKRLECAGTGVGNAAVASLPPGLEVLDVSACAGFTAEVTFGHLPALRVLVCSHTGVGNAAIATLHPALQALYMGGCRGITEAASFAHLPALQRVHCHDTAVGDVALASLPQSLVELHCDGCAGVTAAAPFAHLRAQPSVLVTHTQRPATTAAPLPTPPCGGHPEGASGCVASTLSPMVKYGLPVAVTVSGVGGCVLLLFAAFGRGK